LKKLRIAKTEHEGRLLETFSFACMIRRRTGLIRLLMWNLYW